MKELSAKAEIWYIGKRDASNLKSDSETLAKSKLEYKFSARYSYYPKRVMSFQSRNITVATASDEGSIANFK